MYLSSRKISFQLKCACIMGFEVKFTGNFVSIVINDETIASGVKQCNDLYRMFFRVVILEKPYEANVTAVSLKVWHERLGHVNARAIRKLTELGLIKGISFSKLVSFFCDACQIGKSHRLPFNWNSKKVTSNPGEFVYTEVCGPMSVETPGHSRYFVTFKDDATSYQHVYFLRKKSDVFGCFKKYKKIVENNFGRCIKTVCSDNGGVHPESDGIVKCQNPCNSI